jgi:hypothetical protein
MPFDGIEIGKYGGEMKANNPIGNWSKHGENGTDHVSRMQPGFFPMIDRKTIKNDISNQGIEYQGYKKIIHSLQLHLVQFIMQ